MVTIENNVAHFSFNEIIQFLEPGEYGSTLFNILRASYTSMFFFFSSQNFSCALFIVVYLVIMVYVSTLVHWDKYNTAYLIWL